MASPRWSFRDDGDSFTVKRTTETVRRTPDGAERIRRTITSTAKSPQKSIKQRGKA